MTARTILVYTRTADYRHDSIPAGIMAFRALGERHGFVVQATEDPSGLRSPWDAVVFLSTSGEVLDDAGRRDLLRRISGGAGFVGVHSAACTEYGWPEYGDLLGARFDRHPEPQPAVVRVDRDHPATAHLPERWSWTDEWYDFRAPPVAEARVLATVDETTYRGGRTGDPHPLAWCREYGRGRSFYTALGHPAEAYADPDFQAHLLGALTWTARWRW